MENDNKKLWLDENMSMFSKTDTSVLKEKLENMSEEKFEKLQKIKLKDPSYILFISIFFGWFGVDRFMLGDILIGIIKLLTFGLLGILWIIDMFLVPNKIKKLNFEILKPYL